MPETKPTIKRDESKKTKPSETKSPGLPERKPAPRPTAPSTPAKTVPSSGARAAPIHKPGDRPARPPARPGAPAVRPPASRPGTPAARPGAHRPGASTPRHGYTQARPPARQAVPGVAPAVRPPTAIPAPKPAPIAPPPPPKPPVELPDNLTVRDLAAALKVGPIDIIKKLMANGIMANINQPIDFDTASLIAGELGFEVLEQKPEIVEPEVTTLTSIPKKHEYVEAELADLVLRPPVVTVMGHVDHGKTSILDAIRHAEVAAGEAGGITQHIGAYQVLHDGKGITFLDTPGHEAFTEMRARGAQATDIAIIVVAADDGVMPQTREAISHARAAQVPIIIALNKVDKANANPERVKQQLADLGLAVYGGKDEVTVVSMSAKQKTGVNDLLENILLVSELADLRANPKKVARGIVIESKLDKQQGAMATLLVQEGTLRVGDVVWIGSVWGKIRAMFNDRGEVAKEAAPADPVAVTGLSDVPPAGEKFIVMDDERAARNRAEKRALAKREAEQKAARPVSLYDLFAQFQAGHIKELNLIVKADVQGSLEPIVSSLEKLSDEKIKVKIIHQGIGTLTRSDVMLAVASQGIVIGFNVGVESAAQSLAESEGVDVRQYNIIYKLIEDIEKALKGMLEPVYEDRLIGRGQVVQLFRVKKNVVAGLRITQGKALRTGTARVVRGGAEVFKGNLAALKRFTDDVKEVAEGYECGLSLEKFTGFQEGDQIEFYQKVKVS
ncbi:MAG: translation initiation factor IF-2 [Anaerolineales bacterium]|nr:translation initiation factor IF-2 [Anaerolineales bacterium]